MEYELKNIFDDKEYKPKSKKNKRTLLCKIIMFILTIGYLCFFVYEYITKDFDISTKENIFKLILLFLAIFLCGCTTITNSLATYCFAFCNYIIIFLLITMSIVEYLPKEDKTKEVINEIENNNMICTGSTSISDDTSIDIYYNEDEINKLMYTYIFDMESKDGAENLVNRFDKQYIEFDKIYSEITISDKVVVTLTYNIENISEEKKELLDKELISLKELKEKELNNMTCKNRG